MWNTDLQLLVPFGASLSTTLAWCTLRSLSPIYVNSPYSLSSHHPVCGYQEGGSLAISTPHVYHASVHCPVRSLFRTVDSPGGTGGPRPIQRGEQLLKATSCRNPERYKIRHFDFYKRLKNIGYGLFGASHFPPSFVALFLGGRFQRRLVASHLEPSSRGCPPPRPY